MTDNLTETFPCDLFDTNPTAVGPRSLNNTVAANSEARRSRVNHDETTVKQLFVQLTCSMTDTILR